MRANEGVRSKWTETKRQEGERIGRRREREGLEVSFFGHGVPNWWVQATSHHAHKHLKKYKQNRSMKENKPL